MSNLGLRQAAAAAEWAKSLRPDVVVSSAMRRAVDTARPIASACRVPHRIEPALHERRVGELSGTKFSRTDGPWAETLRRWAAGDTAYTTPGAESFDQVRDRVTAAWDRITAEWAGKRVVVVAHGVVCKVLLLSRLDGRRPADWDGLGRVANLSVSELVGRPGGPWRAERLLDVPGAVQALNAAAGAASPEATGVKSEA